MRSYEKWASQPRWHLFWRLFISDELARLGGLTHLGEAGWLPDLENLELKPGGFKFEKQAFFIERPWKPWNENLLQRKIYAVFRFCNPQYRV